MLHLLRSCLRACCWLGISAGAMSFGQPTTPTPSAPPTAVPGSSGIAAAVRTASTNYVLSANDVVQIKVFREDDLETRARIANDGTITFPLLGSISIGGKTVGQASDMIRDLLDKDYLVNPQVMISIMEFAKRRFTVLGEVQKPGAYDMPDDQSLNLIQAISMAGGYTRLAAPSKVTVQRQEGAKRTIYRLDANKLAKDRNSKMFLILPEDTITVAESIF